MILSDGARQDSWDRIKFDVTGNIRATLECPLSDLSAYNTIALAVHNEGDSPVRVGLRLIHGSRTFRAEMNDFSTTGDREIVERRCRREIKFHRECFGTYGLKTDWDDIREIQVHFALEWGKSTETPSCVYLEGFFVEGRRIPNGPRLTAQGLASHALGEKNLKLLCLPKDIGPFNEQNLGLLIPPPHPYQLESPQEILDGCIMGQRMSLPYSWDGKPVAEMEWEHFLHRHHVIRTLVRHFADTGSVEAAQWINGAIRSWISSFPAPLEANGGASPAWETLSVAWRIREWLWTLGLMWKSPVLEVDTRIAMLASLWESAQSLMHHKGHPNNWLVVESGALALLGLCLPQFKEAEQWFSTGLERLSVELKRQFFADGVHFELSPKYHAICMGVLLDLMYAAACYKTPIPDSIPAVVKKGIDYLSWIMRPDYTWPALNDSGGILGNYRPLMRYADRVLGRSHSSDTAEEVRQSPVTTGCKTFPDAGITIIRSGQYESPTYVLFRSGPAGASHVHRDVLSFELHAMARNWLVDPGITSYAPYESTAYYRSAKAHNTILIDGNEPRPDLGHFNKRIRSGRENTFPLFGEDVHIASGIYRGPWDGLTRDHTWIRSVICVKNGQYFLLVDELFGVGSHVVTTCWQLAPAAVHFLNETNSILAVDTSSGTAVQIKPVTTHEGIHVHILKGSELPWGGWVSKYGSDVPAPNCCWDMKVDFPARIVWFFTPVGKGASSDIVCNCVTNNQSRNTELEIYAPNRYKDIVTVEGHDPSSVQGRQWHERMSARLIRVYAGR